MKLGIRGFSEIGKEGATYGSSNLFNFLVFCIMIVRPRVLSRQWTSFTRE